MLAVDTNVVVRCLTNDHPQQSQRARKVIDAQDVWVPTTVLLETEWVLRSVYHHTPLRLRPHSASSPGCRVSLWKMPPWQRKALDWVEHGMDFVDALHLRAAAHCTAFLTFDAAFAKSAEHVGVSKLRAP